MSSGVVKLKGAIYSPFVNWIQIALNLKLVEFEFIHDNLNSKSELLLKSDPVHKKISIMIHNNKCIYESGVFVQYINETWVGNSLLIRRDPCNHVVARFQVAYCDHKVSEDNGTRGGFVTIKIVEVDMEVIVIGERGCGDDGGSGKDGAEGDGDRRQRRW